MSGPPPSVSPMAPPPGPWVEYRNPQGRPYWYHTLEKRSVWEKPLELKTPRERALDSTPWKEYKSGERSYYVHSETKQSTWTLPDEVKQLLDRFAGEASNAPTPGPALATASPAGAGTSSASTPLAHAAQRPIGGASSPSHLDAATATGSPYAGPPGPAAGSPAYPQMAMSPPGAGGPPMRPQPYNGPAPNAGFVPAGSGVRPTGPPPGFSPPGPSSLPARPPVGPAMSPDGSASPVSTPSGPVAANPASSLPQRPPPSNNVRAEPVNFRGDKEAAEAAFISLLEQKGVDTDWTWEVTMRAIITEPLYKALKTIAERKNAFAKYIEALKKRKAEERAQRQEKLRPIFKAMLVDDGRIKSYSSFATVKKLCAHLPAWSEARDEDEARTAYEAVMREIKESEAAHAREIRHRNMDMLMSLLKTFEADVLTRWRDAHRTVIESDEYAQDAHLKTMDVADMLIVFDEHMNSIEKEASEASKREASDKKRKERKNRDGFKALLAELQQRGEITARSTWGETFARVKDDDRFLRLVGQPGSSPLDLFYDLVDDLDQTVMRHLDDVHVHLSRRGKEVDDRTALAEFSSWIAELQLAPAELQTLFHHLRATYLHRVGEERRRAERRKRHAIDDLRYALRKLDPPPSLDAPFDEVRESISHLAEYRDLNGDDDGARQAWEKHVRRQREKGTGTAGVGAGVDEGERRARRGSSATGGVEGDEGRKRKMPMDPFASTGVASAAGSGGTGTGAGPSKRYRDPSTEPENGARRYGHASRRDRDRDRERERERDRSARRERSRDEKRTGAAGPIGTGRRRESLVSLGTVGEDGEVVEAGAGGEEESRKRAKHEEDSEVEEGEV